MDPQQATQYPTPQQQAFYAQQHAIQQQQAMAAAAAAAPGGWNNNGGNNQMMMGGGVEGYQGNYGQMGMMNQQQQQQLNGSMGEVPYNQMQQYAPGQQMGGEFGQPFVSNTAYSSSVVGAPGRLSREGSQTGSSDSGCSTPLTPGGTKRRNNPYAQTAVADPTPGAQLPASVSPVGMYPQFSTGSGHGSAPVSPAQPHMNMDGSWGSPASAGLPSGAPGFSPAAAPLPTSLPQREGNIRGHRGRNQHGNNHSSHGNSSSNYQGGGGRGGGGNNSGEPGTPGQGQQPVTHEDVLAQAGHYVELARTANGSSFIQAAVREGSDPANLEIIWAELSPCLNDLFLDAHGCYVIKSTMERLPPQQLNEAVAVMANDPQLVFSMCTHSLHTRRVVQFLLDSMDCPFVFALLTTHCAEIAMTQQGCIVMQRAMDTAQGQAKLDLYNAIYSNLLRFCTDPFANYVVQHMLEVGDKAANSAVFRHQFLDHVVQLSCNKFASNVMEKALFHLDEALQHELLVGIYDSGEDTLYRMLQDSFGNYLIQSSIALAQYKDVFFISEKLRPVLQRTPYGHKIEGRLDRRLKGKAVGTRSPMIGATFKANQGQSGGGAAPSGNQGGRGGNRERGGSAGYNKQRGPPQAAVGSVDSLAGNSDDGVVEEPW